MEEMQDTLLQMKVELQSIIDGDMYVFCNMGGVKFDHKVFGWTCGREVEEVEEEQEQEDMLGYEKEEVEVEEKNIKRVVLQ